MVPRQKKKNVWLLKALLSIVLFQRMYAEWKYLEFSQRLEINRYFSHTAILTRLRELNVESQIDKQKNYAEKNRKYKYI